MSRRSFIRSITGQPRRVDLAAIARSAARAYGLEVDQIMNNRRGKYFMARASAMKRAHDAGVPLQKIGAFFSKDHTSVLNAIRRAS